MNINNLPLVEELSEEQATNIVGGMEAIKAAIGDTGGGSYPSISGATPPPPPPPKDEEVSPHIGFFSL